MLLGQLKPLMDRGLDLGFCARTGQVDIRLSGSGPEIQSLIASAEATIRAAIDKQIYGSDDETIEQVVVGRLIDTGETLVVAESCTGGLLGHHITNVPGLDAADPGARTTLSEWLPIGTMDVARDRRGWLVGTFEMDAYRYPTPGDSTRIARVEGSFEVPISPRR